MTRIKAVAFILLLSLVVVSASPLGPAYGDDTTSSPRVVIGFKPSVQLAQSQVMSFIVAHGGGNLKFMNWALGFIVVSTNNPSTFIASVSQDSSVKYVHTVSYMEVTSTPNDPYFSQQYLSLMRVPQAWDTVTGNPAVIVAVVDTGVDYNHPDLAGNMWTAPDGSHGWDFVNNSNNPMDDFTPDGHGTDVAGVIAATMNNGIGIAGVAQVKVMAIKVCGGDGYCADYAIASGVQWAVDHGAQIINLSIGGSASSTIYDSMKYAADRGVLLVASAGNCNHGPIMYPAAYSEVIAVTGTNVDNGKISDVSCIGPEAELSAPVIAMTTYTNGGYGIRGGTSFSAPYVSGIAALVKSHNTGLTGPQVRSLLDTTAVQVEGSGRNVYYGYGRVDAYSAVLGQTPTPDFAISTSPPSVSIAKGTSGSITIIVASLNGFSSSVSFTATSIPPGTTASFLPNPATPSSGGSTLSTMTLSVDQSAQAGSYTAIITGTSGSLSHSTTLALSITGAATVQITWQLNGVSNDATGNIITINGVGYTYSNLPKTFSWVAGSTYTVSATPTVTASTGKQYPFSSWTNGGGLSGVSGTYVTPSSAQTVTANYVTQYYLTIQVNPSNGGSVFPNSGWQNAGMMTQVTASAAYGWRFTGWTGSGSGSYTGSGNPISLTMNAPITELANFASTQPTKVTMTVSHQISGGGSGYSAPTFNYIQDGASKQYVLTSSPVGIQVDDSSAWSVTNPLFGSSSSERWYSSQQLSGQSSAQTIIFLFQHQYLLTISVTPSGRGTTSPSTGAYWYASAQSVSVMALPLGSYTFDVWTLDGTPVGSPNPFSVSMNGPHSLTANFKSPTVMYMVTFYTNTGSGSITVSSIGTYYNGQSAQFSTGSYTVSATPPTNYSFQSWSTTGSTSMNGNTMYVSGDGTLTVNFQPNQPTQYTITVNTNPPGLDNPQGGGTYNAGTTITISISAVTGYTFQQWNRDGQYYTNAMSFTYPVDVSRTFTAVFQQTQPTSTVTIYAKNSITGTPIGSVVVILAGQTAQTDTAGKAQFTGVVQGTYTLSITSYVTSGCAEYTFSSWSDQTYQNPRQISILGTTTLTAAYVKSSGFTVTVYTKTIGGTPISGTSVTLSNSNSQTKTTNTDGSVTFTCVQRSNTYTLSVSTQVGPGSAYSFSYWTDNSNEKVIRIVPMLGPSDPTYEARYTTGPLQVTMNVSYQVTGGGNVYSSPAIYYLSNGISMQYTLTQTAALITVDQGTQWSISPNPLSGSSLSERWYSTQPLSGVASATTITFVFQHQFYLTMQVNPTAGGNISPNSGWQNTGASLQISASPATGYTFMSWTGAGSGSFTGKSNPTYITVNGPTIETANFQTTQPTVYMITVGTSPSGLDNPQGGGTYYAGSSATISVGSVSDYTFVKWQKDGIDYSTQTSFSYTVDTSHTFTAIFQPNSPNQYTITVGTSPSGLDNPQGAGSYNQGTSITINVGSVSGYSFVKWQRDGIDYSTQTSFSYTVDASHTFTATFQQTQQSHYEITVNTSPFGLDGPWGGGTFASGALTMIGINEDVPGYTFQKWQKDGVDYTTDRTFQYTVDMDHTFTAIFRQQGTSITTADSHCPAPTYSLRTWTINQYSYDTVRFPQGQFYCGGSLGSIASYSDVNFDWNWGWGTTTHSPGNPQLSRNPLIALTLGRSMYFPGGTYVFTLGADDGADLFIDGQRIIHFNNENGSYRAKTVIWTGQGHHNVAIVYHNNILTAHLSFNCQEQTQDVVSPNIYFTAMEQEKLSIPIWKELTLA